MHRTVLDTVQAFVNEYKLNEYGKTVVEIGALDVNGSVRQFFSRPDEEDAYIGTDMTEGNGVDEVVNAHNIANYFTYTNQYDGEEEQVRFDIVVCCEMLEHDNEFWITLWNVGAILNKGGYFILSARGATTDGRAMFEHDYPADYWRFMPQSVEKLFDLADCDLIKNVADSQHPGFIAIGRKR